MPRFNAPKTHHERLVFHVQDLERLEALKAHASEDMKEGFERAKADGFDPQTLRAVLKLRKMTPDQRRERRALEAIYLAELGMLDGDPLPDEARRRLDGPQPAAPPDSNKDAGSGEDEDDEEAAPAEAPKPAQPSLVLKDPAEAREEGEAAAAAGQRIYENPYPAGDPCRAAWDEGWCAKRKSHGMELPEAYRRRTDKKPGNGDEDEPDADGADEKGAA